MAINKQILFCLLLLLSITGTNAQLGGTHNYLDSSYIPKRSMNQQGDFLSNKNNFPAKPRDMLQLSVWGGYAYVDGDCPTAIKGPGNDLGNYAYGFGVGLRKSLGYVLSVRASFSYYNMLGLDYQRNGNYNNHPLIEQLYLPIGRGYIHAYRTQAFVPAIDALVSLNNIMFHSKQSRLNIYVLAGYSPMLYKTTLDLVNNQGQRHMFETLAITGRKRTEIRQDLRNMMDGWYETKAEVNDRRPKIGSYNLRHCFNSGVGFEYRMGKNWSLSGEYRRTQTRDDYIDGYFRQSGDLRNPVFTSEWDNVAFTSLGANFNIGNSKKRVPPLWWLNPLEFAYGDLTGQKIIHLPKITLKDEDGDGVTDQFDLEPNTPAGCPVDTHGITADTDGDGVPDCKDKEKLTQLHCFPVDVDGVGKCPEPECCKTINEQVRNWKPGVIPSVDPDISGCKIGSLPSIQFKPNSIKLSKDAEAVLADVAQRMQVNPDCRVRVVGYGENDKRSQQLSWDRVNVIIKYLTERQGVSESRFIFSYGNEGDANTVDLQATMEQGPMILPAPHSQYKRSK